MLIEENSMLFNVLKAIEAISCKEYQTRVWIEGRGPECDDLGDTADFFIDVGRVLLKDFKDFNITKNQRFLLQGLWDEFNRFFFSTNRPYLVIDFIDTPEWTKITEMAKEVLKAFHWKPRQDGES
jgi:hypothetical protein